MIPFLLAGCSGFGGDNSAQAQCERAASDDPEVVRLELANGYRYADEPDLEPEIMLAKRRVLLRCLREKGLAAPGGVEPVTPRIPSLF